MDISHLSPRVHQIIREISPEIVQHRRQLHRIPELAHFEFKSSAYIKKTLESMGLKPQTGLAETGITVDQQGKGSGFAGFRCDIDGLPITEDTGLPFSSQHHGKMHACGHDMHTAIGIGIVKVLQCLATDFPGRVRVLFQPAEETQPGGALSMIADGAIEGLDLIYSLHVDPTLDTGQIGVKFGPHLASVDIFEIQIIGDMGHAAHPHLSVDAVLVAAKVVMALHSIPSRKIDPLQQIVITISMIHGGEAKNVMPGMVILGGSIRTLDEGVREQIPEIMHKTISGITSAFDARYQMKITEGAPVLFNDFNAASLIMQSAQKILGDTNALELPRPRMGSEDFAHYLKHIPGAQIRLGVRAPGSGQHALHSSKFVPDENAIAVGMEVMVMTLLEFLAKKNTSMA